MQRKDQSRPTPPPLLYPVRFSVDNLSWPLSSRELCSRALGQDPGSRPPLGHRLGVGAGRPARSEKRQAGILGRTRRSASQRPGRRAQASRLAAPPARRQRGTFASCAPLGSAWDTLSSYPRPGRSKTGAPATRVGAVQDERLGFNRQLAMNWDNHGRQASGEGAGTEWVWAGAAGEGAEGCRWPRGVAPGWRVGVAGWPRVPGARGILWHFFGGRGVGMGRGPRWADGGGGLRPGQSDGREDGSRKARRPDGDQQVGPGSEDARGCGERVSRMWPESPRAVGDQGSGPGRVSGASACGPAWRAEAVGSRSRPHL